MTPPAKELTHVDECNQVGTTSSADIIEAPSVAVLFRIAVFNFLLLLLFYREFKFCWFWENTVTYMGSDCSLNWKHKATTKNWENYANIVNR